mgnify:CR=1 FL=1
MGVEQAYLDYRLNDWLTLRTGLILAPIGIINETHEPPTFNGVERPPLETRRDSHHVAGNRRLERSVPSPGSRA